MNQIIKLLPQVSDIFHMINKLINQSYYPQILMDP
jgi:hypothetical protein